MGKPDHRVIGLRVAADEFVRFRDADYFLHSRHLFERSGIDLAFIAGDADGGALRSGHGVSPVPERFNFLANRANLLFGGLRAHDYKHEMTRISKSSV